MLFGEILEPSSRALIDDSNDYPEYKEPHYEWTVKSEVPLIIDSLVFVETKRINKLFLEFILVNSVPRCKLNDNLIIYEKKLTTGQIAETLKSWIEKAKQIFTITSSSFSSYQGEWSRDHSECVVKSLHTKNSINFNCQN
ncbi:hypothetical protein HHI36_012030 [Cryptolaemus montrouzieri]|uniref:Uncharacterized protein n=1 Tax=Cryptolaemus montrouzieri TaxID=559131 RepID=A0ABD2ND34_9CUCU